MSTDYGDKVLNVKMFSLISFKNKTEKGLLKRLCDPLFTITNGIFFLQETNSDHRILISLNNNKEPKENILK